MNKKRLLHLLRMALLEEFQEYILFPVGIGGWSRRTGSLPEDSGDSLIQPAL